MVEENYEDATLAQLMVDLMVKEKAWADSFIKTGSKKKASIEIGVRPSKATTYGVGMYNRPRVKAYIEYVIAQTVGTPNDNIKFLQGIRDANLSAYMRRVKRVHSEPIKVSLKQVITNLKDELEMEEEIFLYYAKTNLEITQGTETINDIKRQLVRYEIELRKNPEASRIIYGPEKIVTTMELDLVKLADDDEHGRIKSYKIAKDGTVSVEMYNAQDAAVALARIQGVDKGNAPVVNINSGPTPEQLQKLSIPELKKMAEIERKMRS